MRCRRAQQMMTAAVDGEIEPRRRRALDAHVTACESCRRELAATERMLSVLKALPMEAVVTEGLEQATLRRVRLAAAEEEERAAAKWWRAWLPVPAVALATAVVAVLAFGVLRYSTGVSGPSAVSRSPRSHEDRGARAPTGTSTPSLTARAPKAVEPPNEPPPELTAAPDKFMNLHILRNLEKLEHFEAIQTTTLDDEPATPGGEGQPSNG
jgi:anti-sigma factor RsiW